MAICLLSLLHYHNGILIKVFPILFGGYTEKTALHKQEYMLVG